MLGGPEMPSCTDCEEDKYSWLWIQEQSQAWVMSWHFRGVSESASLRSLPVRAWERAKDIPGMSTRTGMNVWREHAKGSGCSDILSVDGATRSHWGTVGGHSCWPQLSSAFTRTWQPRQPFCSLAWLTEGLPVSPPLPSCFMSPTMAGAHLLPLGHPQVRWPEWPSEDGISGCS